MITIILGPQGTGKTSLANAILDRNLEQGRNSVIHDEESAKNFAQIIIKEIQDHGIDHDIILVSQDTLDKWKFLTELNESEVSIPHRKRFIILE